MTKRSEKMSCRIEHDLRKKVGKAATATKRSPSEFMRDALEREVSRSLENEECANENREGSIDRP
jgi:predicted transcriptional regulator